MEEPIKVQKSWSTKAIIWILILLILAIGGFSAWYLIKKDEKPIMILQRRGPTEIQELKTYGGEWTLKMTQNSNITGTLLPTNINSTSTSDFDFTMPLYEGGKFAATSDIIFNAGGNVERATTSGNIQGKSNISGEIVNGKLVFTVKNSSENCSNQVTIPNVGVFAGNGCYQGGKIMDYNIEIDLKDGATTTKTTSDSQSGYTYSGTETWKLIKR